MRIRLRLVAAATCGILVTACSGGGSSGSAPPLAVRAGGCCDDASCKRNVCAASLHCGSGQWPRAVFACCEDGKVCCTADSDCQGFRAGIACDLAPGHAYCFDDCANDDTRCVEGYHCDGSTCVADLPDTTTGCDEADDCASSNCSVAFDPDAAASICAPAGTCAAGNASWPVGYTLCAGDLSARRCDVAGQWSAPTRNPQPSPETCDAGGGAASGHRPAATCTSGLDAADPGFASSCLSCEPYLATATGCVRDCADDDRRCWSGYHCAAVAGNVCVTNGYNEPCDVDAECASGRCDGSRCMPKLTNGPCTRSQDCVSGTCARTSIDASATATYCVPPGTVAPASCADVRAQAPGSGDGTYRIFVGHDWARPWHVDCVDMATTTPLEYLAVRTTGAAGGAANYSQYTAGGSTPGTNVVTRFSKIRIDPATLVVHTGDLRFSTSTGLFDASGANGAVSSISYASAADCKKSGSQTGVGDVDLTGTPFAVAPNEFVAKGYAPAGTATYGSANRIVSLTGGGNCGCMVPIESVYPAGGGMGYLHLVYAGW